MVQSQIQVIWLFPFSSYKNNFGILVNLDILNETKKNKITNLYNKSLYKRKAYLQNKDNKDLSRNVVFLSGVGTPRVFFVVMFLRNAHFMPLWLANLLPRWNLYVLHRRHLYLFPYLFPDHLLLRYPLLLLLCFPYLYVFFFPN